MPRKILLCMIGIVCCLLLLKARTYAGIWSELPRKENIYYENGEDIRINFLNGGFEQPDLWVDDYSMPDARNSLSVVLANRDQGGYIGFFNYFHMNVVEGWNTINVYDEDANSGWRDYIEIQRNGFPFSTDPASDVNFNAHEGVQYAELNAWIPGRLYQICTTKPGLKVYYEYWHRGYLNGVDIMNFYLYDWDEGNGVPPAVETKRSVSDEPDWKRYYGAYVVPDGQEETVFAFESVSSEAGGAAAGNFLDGIFLSYPSFIEVQKEISTKRTDENGDQYVVTGDQVTYTITIENNGEVASSRTELLDVLPDGMNYIEDSLKMEYRYQDGTTDMIDTTGRITYDESEDALRVIAGERVEDGTNIHSNGTGSIGSGESVKITFCAAITDADIAAGTMLANQAYVSYNDLGFEEYNINSEGKLEDEYNVSEVVSIRYARRGSLLIEKELTEPADKEEVFVFKLEYRENSSVLVPAVFYGSLCIEEGLDSAVLTLDEMLPGTYTITEIKSNWRYQIDDPLTEVQSGDIDGFTRLVYECTFINIKNEMSLISGNNHGINNFKQLQ